MTRANGRLIDCASIVREYGVTRSVAEAWVRQLPKIVNPGGVRKNYVRRADLDRLIDDATMAA